MEYPQIDAAIEVLLHGLPPERHFQARTLFRQIMRRSPDDGIFKVALPVSRAVLERVHPANTEDLADEIVVFVQEAMRNFPNVEAFYRGFEDKESEFCSDLYAKFVTDWHRIHA